LGGGDCLKGNPALFDAVMSESEPWMEAISIGCSADDPWETMHREGQRYLYFSIGFELQTGPPETHDYRRCLEPQWSQLLLSLGLSAQVMNRGRTASGLLPVIFGHVWRQRARERFDSVSEVEMRQIVDFLGNPAGPVKRFTVSEFFTGERRGPFTRGHRFKMEDGGVYAEEDLRERR
jgi:hypothetical protein